MAVTEAALQHSLSECLDGDNETLLAQDMDCYHQDDKMPETPHFAVVDLGSASWAVRKIAQAREDQGKVDAYADAEIARIDQWRRTAKVPLQQRIDYLTALLAPYHAAILQADPRAKTLRLPHGELQIRAQQPEWTYSDEALAWLKANHAEWVRVKTIEEPDKALIKKATTISAGRAIDPNGEPIPGVSVVERPPKFQVVTGGGPT